jgi:hypothetical protein
MLKYTLALAIPIVLLGAEPIPVTRSRTPPPQHLVYRALFRHVAHLDEAAAKEDAAGRNGDSLRSYYKHSAALSDRDEASLKRIATECNNVVRALDQKSQQIILRVRSSYPNGRLMSRSALPALPQELKDLQVQRDGLIKGHIDRLKQALGDEASLKFDEFVQDKFAPHVTIVSVVSPVPKKRIPNSPFPEIEGEPHK